MPTFNFVEFQKRAGGSGPTFPESIIRIAPTAIVVSTNIMQHFAVHEEQRAHSKVVKLSIAYDALNKAIKVEYSPTGFSFGIGESNGRGYLNMIKDVKTHVPTGDYRLVPGYANVFQLAE